VNQHCGDEKAGIWVGNRGWGLGVKNTKKIIKI
jgi:hypothetical protein